jgi:hypothetical protein
MEVLEKEKRMISTVLYYKYIGIGEINKKSIGRFLPHRTA